VLLALFLLFGTSILNLPTHNYFYYLCRGRDELSSVMNPGMQAKLDTTNILKVSLYCFIFPNRI
jgi:hypothetical protein